MNEIPVNQPFPVAGEAIFTHSVTRTEKGYKLSYTWHTSTGEACTESDEFTELPQITKYIESCQHSIFTMHYQILIEELKKTVPAENKDMELVTRSLDYFLKHDFGIVKKYFLKIYSKLTALSAMVPGLDAKTKLLQLHTFINNL